MTCVEPAQAAKLEVITNSRISGMGISDSSQNKCPSSAGIASLGSYPRYLAQCKVNFGINGSVTKVQSMPNDLRALPPGDDCVQLDVLGILEGVDKASLRGEILWSWDYLRHYADAFRNYRDEAINVLEIGVLAGTSLKVWLGYFSKATLIGVDIEPKCAALAGGRVHIKIGSQNDVAFMSGVAKTYPLSIVIDDGSHVASDIICSFETLFPLMLPGGTYAVEDLAFHFSRSATGEVEPSSFIHGAPIFPYFDRLVAAKAAHVPELRDASDELKHIYRSIDSIYVVNGAIFIKKKAARNLSKYVAVFEEELRARAANGRSQYTYAAIRYAEFLIVYNHNLERAAQLLEEIVGLEPTNWMASKLLHKALVETGRSEAAKKVCAALRSLGHDVTLPQAVLREWMVYPH